jgi:transcriptional regulator with XRE-family HTH domain
MLGSNVDFGARLKAERERLSLNQADFGKRNGVSRTSQSAYETGSVPASLDYLRAIESAGVDVSFLLWGVRANQTISAEHSELIACYDAVAAHERDTLMTVAGALSGRVTRRPAPGRSGPLGDVPAEALEETLYHLLDGIDADETPAARAHLLAERLPIALSRLRDLQPVAPPVPASPPAPPSARVAEPAMPDRERRS